MYFVLCVWPLHACYSGHKFSLYTRLEEEVLNHSNVEKVILLYILINAAYCIYMYVLLK